MYVPWQLLVLSSKYTGIVLPMGSRESLIIAEEKASYLFDAIVERGLICAGKTEKELNNEIFALAKKEFGISKFWHKRIIRSGPNTLEPYRENPPNLMIQEDDILFLDFGPVFEDWEADFGRTYVLGKDPVKLKMAADVEAAWHRAKAWYDVQAKVTGAQLFQFLLDLAKEYGWEFGGTIGGHLIGSFPHSNIFKSNVFNYIHPSNRSDMRKLYKNVTPKDWILEIHFVDRERKIGGFFEQLL